MKKSIAYLPKNKQRDLYFIINEIKKRLPQTEMIILYGSYARDQFVDFDEIKEQAQEYFEQKIKAANEFLDIAKLTYDKAYYVRVSFLLHQTAENCYHAICLVFTLKDTKQHNLFKLSASVKHYSTDLAKVFPQDTAEEKRLFNLLKDAYMEARYNADYLSNKER